MLRIRGVRPLSDGLKRAFSDDLGREDTKRSHHSARDYKVGNR